MALLPTIPTSFVPHLASAERRPVRADFGGVFSIIAYVIFAAVFVLALGVFFYGRILSSNKDAKDAALAQAEAAIDPATVESFVQLRDRLASSQTLLADHTAFSGFFSALETLLPSTVRFTSLHISLDATGAAKVEGAGLAKSFNALSAASNSFAADGRIKDVIFSKITVNRDSSVSFGFSASLDPKLIAFTPGVSQPFVPSVSAATTSATTTKP
ncbi:MAG TPA: hypothetical protein VMV62_01450 [Candidatus Paceibacterota bacterium]|nr:hypothetical protein [Candidatus Paceibacterota bacterium]